MITYKLWLSGNPMDNRHPWSGMPIFMGRMEGESFEEAVAFLIDEMPLVSQELYSMRDGEWYYKGVQKVCETTGDAIAYRAKQLTGPKTPRIDVWCEGYDTSGNHCSAQHLFSAEGTALVDVVEKFVNQITDDSRKNWRYDLVNHRWLHWGGRTFDNETDARKAFG